MLNDQLLPPSLRAYSQGKSPALPTQAPVRQQTNPQRSKMLAALMSNRQQQPDYLAAGLGGVLSAWDGYNKMSADPKKDGFVEDPQAFEARKQAGMAAITQGVTGAAGAMIPGWGGKIAQIAALMAGQYAKDKMAQSKGQQLQSILNEPDADKRSRMALAWDPKQ
jgi:hypothetical protein